MDKETQDIENISEELQTMGINTRDKGMKTKEYERILKKESLYHYCSLESFISIVKNSSFRLYDVSKSNDSKEIVWFFEKLTESIQRRMKRDNNKNMIYWGDNYDNISKALSLMGDISSSFEQKFYVGCFSEDKDLLSQWTRYADDSTGVAIGFNTNYLFNFSYEDIDDYTYHEFAIKLICKFVKVKYTKKAYQDDINWLCDRLFESIESAIRNNVCNISQVFETFCSLSVIAYENSIEHKNYSFKPEKEWRILALRLPFDICDEYKTPIKNELNINDVFTLSKPHFVSKDNKIVSYSELKFTYKTFINNIVIGSKSKVTEKDIEDFLISEGYPEIKIDKSHSSYC